MVSLENYRNTAIEKSFTNGFIMPEDSLTPKEFAGLIQVLDVAIQKGFVTDEEATLYKEQIKSYKLEIVRDDYNNPIQIYKKQK